MRVYFYIRKGVANKYGEAGIYCRVFVRGERCKTSFAVGHRVALESWDSHKQVMKGRSPEAQALNATLRRIEGELVELYTRNTQLNADQLKELYIKRESKSHTNDFEQLVNAWLKYREGQDQKEIKPITLRIDKTKANLLREWLKAGHNNNISEMGSNWMVRYNNWLTTERKLAPSYREKCIKLVKAVMEWGVAFNMVETNTVKHYKMQRVESAPKEYLTSAEMNALASVATDTRGQELARDRFLFSCHTGLAYADVQAFSMKMVQVVDGVPCISQERTKTGKGALVPLVAEALELVAKYGESFPPLSNQKSNLYLKELATRAGIGKKIGTHTARHTFGMLMLNAGAKIEVVSKMMGHSSIRITEQVYARILGETVVTEMRRLGKVA